MSCQLVEAGIVLPLVICVSIYSFNKYLSSAHSMSELQEKFGTRKSQGKVFAFVELRLRWGAGRMIK